MSETHQTPQAPQAPGPDGEPQRQPQRYHVTNPEPAPGVLLSLHEDPKGRPDCLAIMFTEKPPIAVRVVLKAARFAWSRRFKCWIGRRCDVPAPALGLGPAPVGLGWLAPFPGRDLLTARHAPDSEAARLADGHKDGLAELAKRERAARARDRRARGLCPTCGVTKLTKQEQRRGYQCPECTRRDEWGTV